VGDQSELFAERLQTGRGEMRLQLRGSGGFAPPSRASRYVMVDVAPQRNTLQQDGKNSLPYFAG
jgi:hypothetical protein